MFIVHSCVTLIEYFIVFPVVLKPIIHYPAQPESASPLIDDTRQNAWSNFPVSPPQVGLAPRHPSPCQSSSAPAVTWRTRGHGHQELWSPWGAGAAQQGWHRAQGVPGLGQELRQTQLPPQVPQLSLGAGRAISPSCPCVPRPTLSHPDALLPIVTVSSHNKLQ